MGWRGYSPSPASADLVAARPSAHSPALPRVSALVPFRAREPRFLASPRLTDVPTPRATKAGGALTATRPSSDALCRVASTDGLPSPDGPSAGSRRQGRACDCSVRSRRAFDPERLPSCLALRPRDRSPVRRRGTVSGRFRPSTCPTPHRFAFSPLPRASATREHPSG